SPGCLLPASCSYLSFPEIRSQDDFFRPVLTEPLPEQVRTVDRNAANGYLCSAAAEGQEDILLCSYAAAEVDFQSGGRSYSFKYPLVCYSSGTGPVKVNQVKVPDGVIFHLPSKVNGISTVTCLSAVVALGQPDALTVNDVYCRDDSHSSRKFISSRSPASADFSG